MKDQFVPFELAVKLKELGFDEECFASIDNFSKTPYIPSKGGLYKNSDGYTIACPLWQQAFDWFREKGYVFVINDYTPQKLEEPFDYNIEYQYESGKWTWFEDGSVNSFKTYEEARLACLEKLIEITS